MQLKASAMSPVLRATCNLIDENFLKRLTTVRTAFREIQGDTILSSHTSSVRPKAENLSSPSTNST